MEKVLSATIRLKDQITTPLRNIARQQQAFNNDLVTTRANLLETYNRAYTIRANNTQAIESIRDVVKHSKSMSKSMEVVIKVKDYVTKQTALIKEKLLAIGKMVATPIIKLKDFATNQLSKVREFIKTVGSLVAQPIIKLKDMAFKPLVKLYEKVKSIGNMIAIPIVKIKDEATKVIKKVRGQLDRIRTLKSVQTILAVKDMASKVIGDVTSKLRGISGKAYSAIVSVKDSASGVLSSIQGKLTALAGGVTILATAKIGLDGLGEEQTQKITISNVVENAGNSKAEAKKVTDAYYKELEKFSNATPFSVSEVAGFGVKAMQMAKGDAEKAMDYTKAQGSVKALIGDMRTSQEVSEAFFSASNGNMDSINNILGEQYGDFSELIEGVNTKQKDVLEDMSKTIPGIMSTIGGVFSNTAKKMVAPFGPVIAESLSGVVKSIETVAPKLEATAQSAARFMTALRTGDSSEFAIVESLLKEFEKVKRIATDTFSGVKKTIGMLFEGDSIGVYIESIIGKFKTIGLTIASVVNNPAVQSGVVGLINGFMSMGTVVNNMTSGLLESDSFTSMITVMGGAMETFGGIMQGIFSNPIISEAFTKMGTSIMDMVTLALPPIMDLISALGPVLEPVVSTLGAIFATIFPLIGQIIQDVTPVITKLISDLQPVINAVCESVRFVFDAVAECWPMISDIISTAGEVVSPILEIIGTLAGVVVDVFKTSWPHIKEAVEGVWNFIKPILEWLGEKLEWVSEKVSGVVGWFTDLGGAVSSAFDKFKNSNWNPGNWFGGGEKDGSHAYGLQRVPYNNYQAVLHEGEMVLTKQQAGQYDNMQKASERVSEVSNISNISNIKNLYDNKAVKKNDIDTIGEPYKEPKVIKVPERKQSIKSGDTIIVSKLADTIVVREETDIDKIAERIVDKVKKVTDNYGGEK